MSELIRNEFICEVKVILYKVIVKRINSFNYIQLHSKMISQGVME